MSNHSQVRKSLILWGDSDIKEEQEEFHKPESQQDAELSEQYQEDTGVLNQLVEKSQEVEVSPINKEFK